MCTQIGQETRTTSCLREEKPLHLSFRVLCCTYSFPFARAGVAGVSCHWRKSELWGMSLEGEANSWFRLKLCGRTKNRAGTAFLPAFLTPSSGLILSRANSTGSSSVSSLRKISWKYNRTMILLSTLMAVSVSRRKTAGANQGAAGMSQACVKPCLSEYRWPVL